MSLTWGFKMISSVCIISIFSMASCVGQTKELEKRLYNSDDAEDGQFRYVALIFSQTFCTGSLIDKSWVVTAAHCFSKDVNPEEVFIIAGKADLSGYMINLFTEHNVDLNETVDVQPRVAARVIGHPSYSGDTHDIALVQTKKPFVLNSYVGVIPLATRPIFIPRSCTIAGFGQVEGNKMNFVLQYIRGIRSQPALFCKMRSINHLLCLDETKRGICAGDSGGPMVCQGTLTGVAMGGYAKSKNCGIETIEQYYTSTYHHLQWIHSTTGL